jgi:hypothetical protein
LNKLLHQLKPTPFPSPEGVPTNHLGKRISPSQMGPRHTIEDEKKDGRGAASKRAIRPFVDSSIFTGGNKK